MAIIEKSEIAACYIGEELVCVGCLTQEELNETDLDKMRTKDEFAEDEDRFYSCDRCKKRIWQPFGRKGMRKLTNPQVEIGQIEIENEIIEALARINLSSYESRIVKVVIRQTYGWQKKEANISLSKFNELTGILKPHICRTLKKLLARNILVKRNGKYSLQKDYERWQ